MMKKYFIKIKYLFNKYEISLISASTSFYMIVAIFSLFILILQLHNYISKDNNFLWINTNLSEFYQNKHLLYNSSINKTFLTFQLFILSKGFSAKHKFLK